MLLGLARSKINEFIKNRKIGITYDVDNEATGKARGGIFAEHLIIDSCSVERRGQLSTVAIERGSKFSDNWRVQPRTLNIKIYVLDNDEIFDTRLITLAKNIITGSSRLMEGAALLNYLYESSILCDIKTPLYDYQGFKLINDPCTESWKTTQCITYNTVWQEVPFYSEEQAEDRQRLEGSLVELNDKIKSFLK